MGNHSSRCGGTLIWKVSGWFWSRRSECCGSSGKACLVQFTACICLTIGLGCSQNLGIFWGVIQHRAQYICCVYLANLLVILPKAHTILFYPLFLSNDPTRDDLGEPYVLRTPYSIKKCDTDRHGTRHDPEKFRFFPNDLRQQSEYCLCISLKILINK